MAKLGAVWSDATAHYAADYAVNGLSSCRYCKEKLPKGSLRVGIKVEEGDQWGSSMGFYTLTQLRTK